MVMGPRRGAQLTVKTDLVVEVLVPRALAEIGGKRTCNMGILADSIPNGSPPAGPRRRRVTAVSSREARTCFAWEGGARDGPGSGTALSEVTGADSGFSFCGRCRHGHGSGDATGASSSIRNERSKSSMSIVLVRETGGACD
jgi:hypothetical protein